MEKVQVTLPDGRVVEGIFKAGHKAFCRQAVLIADGETYSGIDAVSQGLSIFPISHPVIDTWLNTFRAVG